MGGIQDFVDLIEVTGTGLIILDCHDDITQCKDLLHGKVAVMGNLNNIEMIRWDIEHTKEVCMELLNRAGGGGGMILSSQGPEIPWDTPLEVIGAIVESAKNWKKNVERNHG